MGDDVYAGDGRKTDFSGKHELSIIQNDLEIFSSSHLLRFVFTKIWGCRH